MKYGEKIIQESRLESWPNKNHKRDYLVEITLPEFTCLCPRSGYPDFAAIRIKYIPDKKIAELKSLKLYINKFRDVSISHEEVTNKILDDFVNLLRPKWIEVIGDFNPRGNVKAVITARHARKNFKFPVVPEKCMKKTR
jgi:7-cyano-7-deazaguanine reductase